MKNSLVLIVLIFGLGAVAHAQVKLLPLEQSQRLDDANYYFEDNKPNKKERKAGIKPPHVHSAVLPMIATDSTYQFEKSPLQLTLSAGKSSDYKNKASIRLYPLADLMGGGEFGKNSKVLYTAGLGAGLDFSSKKSYITAKFLPYINAAPFVADSNQRIFNADLGSNRKFGSSLFSRSEIVGVYQPHKIFTFIGGFGKNFFGEGYRSLLLSDNGPANPFLKFETTFGPVKYVNLYQMWFDNRTAPYNRDQDKRKYSSTHYLSWNVTRWFNIGVFESLVWQANDTLVNRGFDFNYVNPVVLYRPVEYNSGSADNVLLGLNMNVKLQKKHNVYFQLVLDEFLLSEIRASSKWWGNKFGAQLGYKAKDLFVDGLYFQTEFNAVRPFTYSHKESTEAYGNINASITHPLGANFYEVLALASFKRKKLRLSAKFVFSNFGIDTGAVNNGQNLFNPYDNRDGDYDHLIMQGLRTNVFNQTITAEYPILDKIGLYLNFTYNHRLQWTPLETTDQHYLMVGLRTRLWNRYSDY